MVSGKYSALAGAIAREQAMANTTNNMANVNTVGFKRDLVSFESLLRDAKQNGDATGINYTRIGETTTDFTPGPMRVTGNAFDLAINGKGFFKVSKDAETYYTRQGDFTIGVNGMLQTADGFALLGDGGNPISLPGNGGEHVSISGNGEIVVGNSSAGRIGLFAIDDTSKLKKSGNGLFKLDDSGTASPSSDSLIMQGSLELSNVNSIEEMAHMIDGMRKFETYHKVLKSYSDLDQKQTELGTLG